jgi:hypothetical protein
MLPGRRALGGRNWSERWRRSGQREDRRAQRQMRSAMLGDSVDVI